MNKELTLVKKLLVVRDITGFSAEYLILNLHHFDNKQEQHLIYALCSNLHRAAHAIEMVLIERGMHCKDRPYSHHSFNNVGYLDVDLVDVVKKHIDEKEKNQMALNGKGQSIFRSF